MKFYLLSTKIFALFVLTLLNNLVLAEDDDFKVVAVKKPGTALKICPLPYDPNNPGNPINPGEFAPAFTLNQSNMADPNFDLEVIFETDIPTNGTLFEVNVSVFVKNQYGNFEPVSLVNASYGVNYTRGSRASILNGEVDLNVQPEFYELTNCEYYFVFGIVDLSYSAGQTERDFSFLTEEGLLTKDRPGCAALLPASCSGSGGLSERKGPGLESEVLQIYPNPSLDGYSSLSLSLDQSNLNELEIQVMNTQGQVVQSWIHEMKPGTHRIRIPLNLSNNSPGLYLLKVRAGQEEFIEKLIHQ